MATRSFLAESMDNWRDVRHGLIEEVENIRATSFDFRPAPDVRSVRELVQHILEVAYMATAELSRADTNFRRVPWPELLEMHGGHVADAQTKRELLELLRSQMAAADKKFRSTGDLEMMQFIENFDGSRWTKLQWLHHCIAHEMYHRGQVAVYERLMGVEPALTQKIRKSADG